MKQQSVNTFTPEEYSRIKMQDWTIDQKIEYNLSHFFCFFYLMKNGYSILDATISKDTGNNNWQSMSPDELGEYFIFWIKREKPKLLVGLYKEMKNFFTNNPQEIFANRSIYNQFI